MAVPTQSDLKSAIESAASVDIKQNNGVIMPALSDFMDHFCKDISTCWSAWATSVNFGGVAVSGAGIGAWAGTGTGGSFDITITTSLSSLYNTTDESCLSSRLHKRIRWSREGARSVARAVSTGACFYLGLSTSLFRSA